ncbi:MAG TPA: metal ABC transporter substrate-binding protein [Herpetosiphonaceae bacterium]
MLSIIGWRRWLALVLCCGLLAACGSPNTSLSGAEGLPARSTGVAAATGSSAVNVIATTSIIADLVKNVGGERVNVHVLLPPGTDPHTYAPTPSDVQAIAEAQIVFENGLGLEAWLEELTRNAGGSRPIVAATQGITPLASGDEHADEGKHADEDEHAEGDPHMWFDVQNTMRYVENIRDGLKQVDPASGSAYDANAAAYIEQLRQLDAEIVAQVAGVPAERRKLITNHDTFGYFAKRYGFEVVGNVFEGVSTEQEPSAQQIAQLVRLIEEQRVPAVFTENTVNPRLAEQVASEAGVKVVTTLYTDALGPAGSEGDTYIKMMRFDVRQIVEALK